MKNYVLLAIGFLALISTKIIKYGPVCGISMLAFLIIFLYLFQTGETKKQLAITAGVLILGYEIKYFGMLGIAALDIAFLLVLGAAISGIFVLTRLITKDRNMMVMTLVFPVIWMLVYAVATILRLPSFMRIDYAFFDVTPVIQCAGVISSYGLSFIILWVCSLIVYGVVNKNVRCFILCAGITVAVLAYGAVSLNDDEEYTNVTVAYSTGVYAGDFIDFVDVEYSKDIQCLENAAASAHEGGARVLAFNEEAFEIADTQEEDFVAHAQTLAKEYGIHILIGLDIDDTDKSNEGKGFNRITWIDNKGEILGSYDKYQLIPAIEYNYVRGQGTVPQITIDVDGQPVNVAFAICYDSNFASYIGQIDGADILFLPSWDWRGVTALHYRICGMLSPENDVAMIKPTYDGITIATDNKGRVLTLRDTDETGFETLQLVDIPIRKEAQ